MKVPPHDDRLAIWRFSYARSSLVEAKHACEMLLAEPKISAVLAQSLVSTVVIAYYRPFSKSQLTSSLRKPTLEESMVPAEFKDVHKGLRDMRDCAIGHKDATAFPGHPFNKVIFEITEKQIDVHTVFPGRMEVGMLQQTIQLCDHLIGYCLRELNRYIPVYLDGSDSPPSGAYYLKVDEKVDHWLSLDP